MLISRSSSCHSVRRIFLLSLAYPSSLLSPPLQPTFLAFSSHIAIAVCLIYCDLSTAEDDDDDDDDDFVVSGERRSKRKAALGRSLGSESVGAENCLDAGCDTTCHAGGGEQRESLAYGYYDLGCTDPGINSEIVGISFQCLISISISKGLQAEGKKNEHVNAVGVCDKLTPLRKEKLPPPPGIAKLFQSCPGSLNWRRPP